jgi:PHD/YefM family antitoxin component YafN of YafNO toxin-antitoxin module
MTEAVKHGRHQIEWITISVDEYESMQRTIEVLSDRDLMNQIEEGKREDVKIRDFEEFAKERGI